MAHDFSISSSVLSNGRTAYSAKLNNSNEPKFIFGYKTSYEGNYGLFNTSVSDGQVYRPEHFLQYGFWSYFIYPTAMAESKGSFKCLNTYDRAKFTFSFMQYAAHVPNGDFVVFMKKLLKLPNAKDYFPRLLLKDERIHYQSTNGSLSQLENNSSTQALMDYLNPTLNEVENQELICSARLVHWATNDIKHRNLQVETAVAHFKGNMKEYHKRFGLNNVPADVCLMICDIRHQGRSSNDRIANALNTNGNYVKAFNNLCSIGSTNYQSRITTVRNNIRSLKDQGLFNKKYNAQTGEFV